jgi:ATP-dependent helicase IRC3
MADITIASIQSIASRNRIEKYDPTKFKLVLIDEAHHAVSSRYLETLDHFGVLKMDEGLPEEKPIVVGVSATMSRFDGLKLGKVIDYIVYHRDYVDMIKENWLCPVVFTTVQTNVDFSRVRSTPTGEFNTGDLGLAVNTDAANEVTVRSWLEKARGRKSTIVFCVDVAHVHEMVTKFRHYGVDARPITGTTAAITRKERLNSFRRGEFKVLVNCGVFTEGTDIPNIDCVLLARPTRSKNLLVQMIGRGMRLHPGKTDCYVLDMIGNVERGVVTVPTLMGLDPDEVLKDETMEDATKRAERQQEQRRKLAEANIDVQLQSPESIVPENTTVTFTHYSSVYDLIADGKSERYIRSLSRLAWVAVGPDHYILPNKNGDITISRANDEGEDAPVFTVTETRALPIEVTANKHIKSRPRTLAFNLSSLESALRAADTYAVSKYPRALLLHHATWRKDPASEGQLKFLEKIKGKDPELQDWEGLGKELSKGQAMDMITKIKHGATARFEKLARERKREEKETRKVQELRMREWVAVGAVDGGAVDGGSVAEGKGRGVS